MKSFLIFIKKQTQLILLFFPVFVLTASLAFSYSSEIAAPLNLNLPGGGYATSLNSQVARTEHRSSPSYIHFTCASMNFRSSSNLEEVKTVLGPGSIVQLPNFPGLGIQVHEYNRDGTINFDKTIQNWLEMAKYRRSELGSRHLIPKKRGNTFYLPVKVIQTSNLRFNLNNRSSYGYLALDYLRRKVDPQCYRATTLITRDLFREETLQKYRISGNSYGGYSENHSETTHNGEVSDQPVQNDNFSSFSETNESDLSQSRIFNCNNTYYRRNGYSKHSCLKSLDLDEKAELIMNDVITVNQLRPELQLDPRFSVCVAYRESGFAPNALGSGSDTGMYQVTDSTARYVLNMHPPVTPSFDSGNQRQYKTAMLRSTLAQADLHHSVVLAKAKQEDLLEQINRNPQDIRVLQQLATRYNGSGPRARNYGRRIARCYQAMQKVASIDGSVRSSSGLRRALNFARG